MKTVVMKYIDNLIAWGDQLFRQYTMESINEATQLYILAAEILGTRPEQVPAPKRPNWTYRELEEQKLDVFSNVLIKIEDRLPVANTISESFSQVPLMIETQPSVSGVPSVSIIGQEETLTLDTLFFCIPHNNKLLTYWNTVEDRLFKIRHCMTIEGKVRELPLFQPPIEPGLLVRAAAAGIDIASVLSDMSAPLPQYRFQVMAQKATELCAEARSLGAALLSALEKRDAEELALMRSRHELQLLKAVQEVKKQQVEEAQRAHEGLLKTKELVKKRQDHYTQLLKAGLNANEKAHLDSLAISTVLQYLGQALELAASNAYNAGPDIIAGSAGWGGTPVFLNKIGGASNVGPALSAAGRTMGMMTSVVSAQGTMASIEGGFMRRAEEWTLQEALAKTEGEQVDKQIAAAEIRMAIAEKELKNHEMQVANSKEVDAYMRSKFTNRELYSWMVSQLSTLYFGSYQLAYDLARRAEMAYRYELGLADSDFIKFGYWDSLKKGLLAGEKLHFDLKRMEAAYLEQNRREYEITKHISLALVNPKELLLLRQTGECYVEIPEALFDLDYPGHYMRRIKSISLTIPCVTGPYTGVNCALTLLKSSIRHSNNTLPDSNTLPGSGYKRDLENEDPRFTDSFGAMQSIVTSSAQNDTGLFETNLRDERYLPFEGAGAISTWRIELPREFRQFDYDTISDVILHVRYTAREGGDALGSAATEALWEALAEITELPRACVFSLKHEFPTEWSRLLQPLEKDATTQAKLDLDEQRLPYVFQTKGHQIEPKKVTLLVELADVAEQDKELTVWIAPPSTQPTTEELALKVIPGKFGGLPHKEVVGQNKLGTWIVEIRGSDLKKAAESLRKEKVIDGKRYYSLDPNTVRDILILLEYVVVKKA